MPRLQRVAVCALIALAACSSRTGGESSGPTTTAVDTGALQVTGVAAQIGATHASTEPIKPPFTITVEQRGVGGAEINGVTVNGRPVQINWTTGQPLPVTGSGPGLSLGTAAVGIDAKAIKWALDGAARGVLPGSYTLASSVAVGADGLGTPVDRVTFTAGSDAAMSTTGRAVVTTPPGRIRLEGSEGDLVLAGQFTLSSSTRDRKVTKITFGEGTYEVTLTPGIGGYTVLARLQGRIVAA